jgi:hypothetical protein
MESNMRWAFHEGQTSKKLFIDLKSWVKNGESRSTMLKHLVRHTWYLKKIVTDGDNAIIPQRKNTICFYSVKTTDLK